MSQEIKHVSDTALMVAACRALETESPDGFVRDPFAARLAGERGMAILQSIHRPDMMRFGIGVRSHFLDELLLDLLAKQPVSTVLSLGCGLDTRPWRLDLPSGLRWIEVDFREMLDYKDSILANDTPRCRRERLTADLTNPAERQSVYEAVGHDPALMITEGLLMYLPGAAVEALASEPAQRCGIAYWISDINTTAFNAAVNADTSRTVGHVQASDSLPGEEILARIQANGWSTEAHRSYIKDMAFALERIKRLFGPRMASEPPPAFASADPTGVHRFARAAKP